MGEESFFNALAHIMWDMEIDIFSSKDKTLALISDFVPRCKRQYNRLKAMYECGAMDKIEQAVADKTQYAELMWQAVDLTAEKLDIDEEKAVFAVNRIIDLWGGELAPLEAEEDNPVSDDGRTAKEGEDMLFLQDVTEESQDQKENTGGEEQGGENSGGEEAAQQPQPQEPSLLNKLVHSWCGNDCEQGRPLMAACPIGWLWIIISVLLGAFMVYDISLGDKLVMPVFLYMFIVLIGKRQYRFESVLRLSVAMGVFYLAAAARALWIGSGITVRCVLIVGAALIVFNNGRFSSLLDGEKHRPAFAYPIIFVMSAAVSAGAYAIQNVQF